MRVGVADERHVFACDGTDDVLGRCSQEFGNDGELVNIYARVNKTPDYGVSPSRTIFTREQWFPFQHLGKYAPGAPDINRNIVLLPGQHDFRSPVVTCRDVSGHLRVLDAGKTEITDLVRFRIKLAGVIRSSTLRSQFSLMRILLGFCNDPPWSASPR